MLLGGQVVPPIVNAELKAILLDKTVATPVPSFVKGMEMLTLDLGSAAPRYALLSPRSLCVLEKL